ncbi:MAG TPA: vitamin K epoxide reductase family protein [Candidatus Polarisedimenticolia bacterium]|nr:vitamin K epoxide reductase family protein [Candidatus Polarisedimenticolia bacterium]
MSSKSRILLLASALLGLGASSVSSYVHYNLLTKPAYSSFCDVSATVSCTEAYTSQYGSFMGVPVAILGVVFFAVVLVLTGVAGRPSSSARETVPAYLFVLSTIGLAFALYLAWASYVVLKVFCILCALTYVSVIAIFIISGGATSFPMTTLPGRASRDVRTLLTSPLALILALVVVGGAAAAIMYFPRESTTSDGAAAQAAIPPISAEERTKLEAWWDVQPKVELPIAMSAGAKVQIVKFSDYQCPGCRAAHEALKPVLAKYDRGVVEYVFKHYPLEPECNPNVPGGNHFAACEAAAAYVMARGTGFQQKLDDWLFENQRTLTPDVVKQAAKDQAGIKDFDARYPAALQEVKTDASMGGLLKVRYTPTIYLNGRMIAGNGAGVPPAQYIDALVEIELKRAK